MLCAHLRAKGRLRAGVARQSGGLPDGAICRFCVTSFRPRALQPNTDTLTVHRERPGGRSFFAHFQQRKAMPFTWPAADRNRSSARTWIGEGLPISCRGWYNKIDLMGRAPAGAKCPKVGRRKPIILHEAEV